MVEFVKFSSHYFKVIHFASILKCDSNDSSKAVLIFSVMFTYLITDTSISFAEFKRLITELLMIIGNFTIDDRNEKNSLELEQSKFIIYDLSL